MTSVSTPDPAKVPARQPAVGGPAGKYRLGFLTEPATLVAGAGLLVSGALLYHWLSRVTFWRDEWGFLLHRRSWDPSSFFDPDVEHLHAIPVLVYKVQESVFGLDSPRFSQVIGIALFLLSVALLFIYLRERVGGWLGVAGILPILFLGASWEVVLFPFMMSVFGSMACGIGAFLLLQRDDRRGDVAATGLLIASLLFSDVGIPFVAGLTVELALTQARFRRAYVVVIPTVLWLLWYAGWGHNATTFLSVQNAANLPSYVLDGLSASLSGLLGLSFPRTDTPVEPLDWGRPLLIVAVALAAWRIHRIGQPSNRLLAVITVTLVFWGLTALNANPLAPPDTGRYVYMAAILVLMVAAELARGVRAGPWTVGAILAAAVLAASSNLYQLRKHASELADIAQLERAGLSALELTRDRVDPDFKLDPENSDVDYLLAVDARSYLSAVDAYGSPADSTAQLAAAPEGAKVAADKVFAGALGVGLRPVAPIPAPCITRRLAGAEQFTVPRGGVILSTGGLVQAALRRYATESFPVALGDLPPGRSVELLIPTDRSPQRWTLQLTGEAPLTVCRPPT